MRKLLYAILFLTLMLSGRAMATEGSVIGQVLDFGSGEAIPHVTVIVEGTKVGEITDSEGHFHINRISAGKHHLIASIIGYQAASLEVRIIADSTVQTEFRLKESILQGKGVVITGTRTPRFIKDVPVYTEVLTHQEIEDKSAHSIFEALDGVSGIRVEQQCQACNFSVLRMQGLGADHTQILLDGQPIYSGLASVYGLQQIGTADIDQIEIVKGAGSALYGSNAIAGAINIISHIPSEAEGHVGIEVGQYGTNKYDISAGTRQDNLAVFLFAQQNRGDVIDKTGNGDSRGEVYHSDGISDRVRTNIKNAGFNLVLENLAGPDRITIRGRAMGEERLGGQITDDLFENIFAPGTERILTDRYSVEFGYGRTFGRGIESDLSINYSRHNRNATNDTFLGDYKSIYGQAPPVEELRPYIANENLFVAVLNFMIPAGSQRILVGTQFTSNKLDETGRYIITDEDNIDYGLAYTSVSEKHAHELGFFLQDEWRVNAKLEIVGGLRFDYHKSEDNFHGSGDITTTDFEPIEFEESALNPRFAAKYSLTPQITLRASFGTGFRVPYGFSEDLHLCSGSPRVYKDISLQPEKSRSLGFSADYQSPSFDLNLNFYRTDLLNRIDFSESTEEIKALGYTYQWKNIDDGYTMGVEIGTNLALKRNLKLAVNFEFNKSEYDNPREDWLGTQWEEDSRKFSRYPQTSGDFKIQYTPEKWDFIVDAAYKGRMFIDLLEPENPEDTKIKRTEPHIILNSRIARKLSERYNLYLGVKNLNDYVQEEIHVEDAAFMYAPTYGRLVYGGIGISL